MKLQDLMEKPLKDVLTQLELIKLSPYTDKEGNIQKLVLEYAPEGFVAQDKPMSNPWQ